MRELNETLGELRASVEVAIDFAEEEIALLSDHALQTRLSAATAQLQALQANEAAAASANVPGESAPAAGGETLQGKEHR